MNSKIALDKAELDYINKILVQIPQIQTVFEVALMRGGALEGVEYKPVIHIDFEVAMPMSVVPDNAEATS